MEKKETRLRKERDLLAARMKMRKKSKVLYVSKHKLLFKFPFRYFTFPFGFKDETKCIS